MHQADPTSVPFESLNIHMGRPISLDLDALVAKLVAGGRGGFCYENNSLFAAALGAIGLPHELLSARVSRDDGSFGPPFDHLATRSKCGGGEHLLDVGFGEGFRTPLPIDGEWYDQAPSADYRARYDGDEVVVERRRGEQIRLDYRIDLRPRDLAESLEMSHYHQTSPDSGFTRQWTASLATQTGRVTVVPGRPSSPITDGGRKHRWAAPPSSRASSRPVSASATSTWDDWPPPPG